MKPRQPAGDILRQDGNQDSKKPPWKRGFHGGSLQTENQLSNFSVVSALPFTQ